jgi:uncharacterized protein (DUF1778 family)
MDIHVKLSTNVPEEKQISELLDKARIIVGIRMNQFVLQAAVKEARRLIKEYEVDKTFEGKKI